MIFVHTGPIDDQYIQDLTNALNTLTPGEEFAHYISSEGGIMQYALLAVELINTCPNPVSYIAFEEMSSAAFHMFFKVKRPRGIQKDTMGMIHQRYKEGFVNTNGKVKAPFEAYSIFEKKGKEMFREDSLYFKKLGLTADQLKKFKEGGEVYFTDKQLNQLLQNQIKNGTNRSRKTSKGTTASSSSRGRKKA